MRFCRRSKRTLITSAVEWRGELLGDPLEPLTMIGAPGQPDVQFPANGDRDELATAMGQGELLRCFRDRNVRNHGWPAMFVAPRINERSSS